MKYLIGRICAAILSFFSFGSILFIFNLKFVFYEDYLIVPNGTYREYLKKKDRIIKYTSIQEVYLDSVSIGIPHIIIKCGRGRKMHTVNTFLFSTKISQKIVKIIQEKANIEEQDNRETTD